MADVFTLGGRLFEPAVSSTTFEQDTYLMALVHKHRIHEVVASGGDIAAAVLSSGDTTRFLAGLLSEVDVEWSSAGAEANAGFFGKLRGVEEKQALHATLGGLIAGFLGVGGNSSAVSPTSSGETGVVAPRRRPRARKAAPSSASGSGSAPASPTTIASA